MSSPLASETPTTRAQPRAGCRALLIANPHAGPGLWQGARPAADHLRAAGWSVDVVETEAPQHATRLAARAVAERYDAVIACGGDGTINEVIQALAHSSVALGIIPTGTANVLARELRIPADPVRAAEAILGGRPHPIDLGRANGRAFVMMAGIGLDADVIGDISHAAHRPHRWFKALSLFAGAVRRFFVNRGTRMTLMIDGQRHRGRILMAVVANIRGYGGVLQIADTASLDDGLLDVVLFHHVSLVWRIIYFLGLLIRRHRYQLGVSYHQARRVEVSTRGPVAVQVDGDLIGHTPMVFEVEPGALQVILPNTQ